MTPEEIRRLLADVPILLHERAGPVPTADVVELLSGRAARTTAERVQLSIDPAPDVVSGPHAPQVAKQPGPGQDTEAGHRPGAGPGQETEAGYRPGARMRRRVIRRDQRCRFPGCDRRGRYTDLDHVDPWPRGPTADHNLQCLCRRHHRAKHEGGWRVTMSAAGRCTWTSPTGRVYVTDPGLPEALLDLGRP